MGLFGKSKKEKEREAREQYYQENFGMSLRDVSFASQQLGLNLGSRNIDALIKIFAPGYFDTIAETYRHTMTNTDEIHKLNQKYDMIIELLQKQNELLATLAPRQQQPVSNQYQH